MAPCSAWLGLPSTSVLGEYGSFASWAMLFGANWMALGRGDRAAQAQRGAGDR